MVPLNPWQANVTRSNVPNKLHIDYISHGPAAVKCSAHPLLAPLLNSSKTKTTTWPLLPVARASPNLQQDICTCDNTIQSLTTLFGLICMHVHDHIPTASQHCALEVGTGDQTLEFVIFVHSPSRVFRICDLRAFSLQNQRVLFLRFTGKARGWVIFPFLLIHVIAFFRGLLCFPRVKSFMWFYIATP